MKHFECMLAHKTKPVNWDDCVARFVQPKLDGVRCYTRLVDGVVRMYSRNHKEFKNAKHISTELKGLFRDNPTLILDGELYNHKFKDNFNKIISLVRKTKPSQADKFESSSLLQYHVYDLFDTEDPFKDFIDRTLWITSLVSQYGFRMIKTVDTKVVWNDIEVNKYHKNNKELGFEGSILRTNDPYEQKRSYTLQKIKEFQDDEAIITGYVAGRGKRRGGIGKFICRDAHGIEFGVPVMATMDILKDIWKNRDKYLNEFCTFTYFEKTPRGSYRHPLFKELRNYE